MAAWGDDRGGRSCPVILVGPHTKIGYVIVVSVVGIVGVADDVVVMLGRHY